MRIQWLHLHCALALGLTLGLSAFGASADSAESDKAGLIERGRYLVKIAGCNDCHTPGYAGTAGAVPESDWLTGDSIGFRGPWGTTYPSNLRLLLADTQPGNFLKLARHKPARPPMPWFALRDMSDADLKALLAFVQHLGPKGQAAPDWVPPGEPVHGPVVEFPAPPSQ